MSHIRIENDGMFGHTGRVVFVATDGTETEISDCICGLTLQMRVGDANTATLDVIKVVGHSTAELLEVAVTELKPRRRRLLQRVVEVTRFGDTTRRYVKV